MVQRLIKIKLPCKALQTAATLLADCTSCYGVQLKREMASWEQAKAGTYAWCGPGHDKVTQVAQVLADLTEHCHWRHQNRHSKHRLSVTNHNKAINKQQKARPVLELDANSMMMGNDNCLSCRLTDFCRCFRKRVMSLMFAFFC